MRPGDRFRQALESFDRAVKFGASTDVERAMRAVTLELRRHLVVVPFPRQPRR